MTNTQLRRRIKEAVDQVPAERLPSLADYVEYLNRRELTERIAAAERDLKAGKGKPWRKVRDDV